MENQFVVAKGRHVEVGEMGKGNQKVRTSSYKVGQSWGYTVQHGGYS